jgi:amino acid adenylation domain-containing protein
MDCQATTTAGAHAADETAMNSPSAGFALTDLQQAYWIGEQGGFRLSTPAFVYQRLFARHVDIERLEQALLQVTRAHPMLRMRVLPDGMQQVAPAPARVAIEVNDLRTWPDEAVHAFMHTRQQALEGQLPPIGDALKFACHVDLTRSGATVHFLLRLVALDARSVGLFFEEVVRAYLAPLAGPADPLLPAAGGGAGAGAGGGAVPDSLKERPSEGDQAPDEPACRFQEFVRAQVGHRQSDDYQRSLQYWRDRAASLPGAPALPFVDVERLPQRSTFVRRQLRVSKTHTAELQAQARRHGLSLTVLVCTAYADVVRLWSRNSQFTLNLLASQRPPSPDMARVIGNFSHTLLLEVTSAAPGFRERALALQQQLGRDIAHAQVSGVEVARLLRHVGDGLPASPVVFASMLGYERQAGAADRDAGFEIQCGAMHTSQVLLDHQAFMDRGDMVLNWDSVDAAFLPGVIEQMFSVYTAHLDALRTSDLQAPLRPALPIEFLESRHQANSTRRTLPGGLLHEPVARACRRHAERTAVIAPDRVLSYAALWRCSTRLAARLRQAGVGRNDLVAIQAPRGWRQVAAMVGVLFARAAYLPVSVDWPASRRAHLIGQPGVKALLVERASLGDVPLHPGVQVFVLEDLLPEGEPGGAAQLDEIAPPVGDFSPREDHFMQREDQLALAEGDFLQPAGECLQRDDDFTQHEDDLAYVMFTSGSTGDPKGVAITHRGAVNTIQDVVERFELTPEDRVIGLSAFTFDLSVYDVFATLGAGATLVLPPHSATPDPQAWGEAVKTQGVTVWNSVPALLDMAIEHLGEAAAAHLATLRLVLLSGDWIPVSLPARLKSAVPTVQLVSLGGATEASIWSNYFVVDEVDPSWKSIPYGWPLSNQTFHVLDADLQPVPTWGVGELYIGGVGLAKGYHGDPVRTAERFVVHPATGERLYRTGDLGRYQPSGCLEFLGRNDGQVKIRGFRIELGEIDAALERCAGVSAAATVVRRANEPDAQLLGFFVPDRLGPVPASPEALRRQLEQVLPSVMVPSLLVEIERLPVTSNGKVDRAALANQVLDEGDGIARAAPRDERERRLAALWSQLLGVPSPGIHDSFFALGGTSLSAVRLLRMVEQAFGQRPPLASMLRHATIASQAALLAAPVVANPPAPATLPPAPPSTMPSTMPVAMPTATPAGMPSAMPAPLLSAPLPAPSATEPVAPLLAQSAAAAGAPARDPVVPVRDGDGPLLVLVHPVGGNLLCYRELIDLAPAGVAIVGLQSPGNGQARTLGGLAAGYAQALRPWLPGRPGVHLIGWSMGGVVAHELARLLQADGVPVAKLTMVESWAAACETAEDAPLAGYALLECVVTDLLEGGPLPDGFAQLQALPGPEMVGAAAALLGRTDAGAGHLPAEELAAVLAEHGANFNALAQHRPGAVDVPMLVFRATGARAFPLLRPFTPWRSARTPVETIALDATHFSIMKNAALRRVAQEAFGPISAGAVAPAGLPRHYSVMTTAS